MNILKIETNNTKNNDKLFVTPILDNIIRQPNSFL